MSHEAAIMGRGINTSSTGRRSAGSKEINEKKVDSILLWAVMILASFGIVMVYSSSAFNAAEKFGDHAYFLKRQMIAMAIGLVLLSVMARTDLIYVRKFGWLLFLASIVFLLLIFVPGMGVKAGGATRWLSLGPITFQPSEIAKIGLVIFIAGMLANKKERVKYFRSGFLGPAIVAILPVGLILMQPDFGTALYLVIVLFVMLFIAGTKTSYIVGAFICAIPVLWHLVISKPYRMQRLMIFRDPWTDRYGGGYQITESLISIGSGGVYGEGLGEGRQKLFFLPEAHTDFIFSIIGEELGLVGLLALLFLFAIIVWRGFRAAYRAEDAFGAYLAIGLTSLIGLQALVNIGVAIGKLPTKGITLPFISYGGSSLITSMIAAGLLLAVSAGRGGFLSPPPGASR